MKKIVCEICESERIRKENGYFVCLDCGTQYSLDEAKKLLQESTLNNQDDYIEQGNAPKTEEKNDLFIVEGGTLVKYKGDETNVTIPNGITEIFFEAFSQSKNLESITIPDGVVKIGNSAFGFCTALKKIKFPNTLLEIGEAAFMRCDSLKEIEISENVTNIGSYAFYGCKSLAKVFISSSVNKIGKSAFGNCDLLSSIKVDEKNVFYDSRNDCNAIIEKQSNCLVCGCLSTFIPDSVVGIGECAFISCSGLLSINIPDSVLFIEEVAFGGCKSLTRIFIPSSVKRIGREAFDGCTITILCAKKSKPIEWDRFWLGYHFTYRCKVFWGKTKQSINRKLEDIIEKYKDFYPSIGYNIIDNSFALNLIDAGILDKNGLSQIGIQPFDEKYDLIFFPVAQLIPGHETDELKLLWMSGAIAGLDLNNAKNIVGIDVPPTLPLEVNLAASSIGRVRYDANFVKNVFISSINSDGKSMYVYYKLVSVNVSKEELENIIIKMNSLVDYIELISKKTLEIAYVRLN